MFNVPILLIVFNRKHTALQVMERIREQKPKQLFIASDGPRRDKDGEAASIADVRQAITNSIDWECEVKTLFRTENLGCGKGPADAISWFFSHVERGIILEDDILPDPSFFSFAAAMLERYKDDREVMNITGQNFQFGKRRGNASYYFSRYPLIWGWATWKRAWQFFDYDMKTISYEDIADMPFGFVESYKYMVSRERDIWDYQWSFAIWKHKGKCIVPQVNLIENIGFGAGATHTVQVPDWYKKLKYGSLERIIHPANTLINEKADRFFADYIIDSKRSVFTIAALKSKLSALKRKLHG
jgi:hypothetical protein